jgi:hypothetical protein
VDVRPEGRRPLGDRVETDDDLLERLRTGGRWERWDSGSALPREAARGRTSTVRDMLVERKYSWLGSGDGGRNLSL